MLGLSGVIACSTPRPIRFRALVHLFSRTTFPGLVPDSGSLLRAYEDIERSSPSDSDLHTLQFGIVPVQGISSDDTDCRRPGYDLARVLIKSRLVVATCPMSALAHFADSSRTSHEGREVPGTDSCTATSEAYWLAIQSPRRRGQAAMAAG